jgi:hypothetical protein
LHAIVVSIFVVIHGTWTQSTNTPERHRLVAVFQEVAGPTLEKQDAGSIRDLGSDEFDDALRMCFAWILAL